MSALNSIENSIPETERTHLSAEDEAELERRLEASRGEPGVGSTWADVEARVVGAIRQAHDDLPIIPLTEAQRAELRRRVEEYERDPDNVALWDRVRDELLKGLG